MYLLVAGTLALAYVIYRQLVWYFSPFRSIPTPYEYPLVSHFPHFVFRKSDMLTTFRQWAEDFKEFGMFRFKSLLGYSQYTVCLFKPEHLKYILSRPDLFVRPPFFQTFLPLTGEGLLTSHGSLHRWQKKLLSRMFSMAQTKYYIPVFNKHVDVMIQIWKSVIQKSGTSDNLDVKYYANNLSFDIIGETAFGYQFNSQTTSINTITQGFRDTVEGVISDKALLLLRIFPILKYAPFGPARVIKEVGKASEELLQKIFKNRSEKTQNGTLTETEKNDLLSMLLNATDEDTGEGISEKLIKDNAYTFIVAGHETTASTVPGALYYLAKFPKYQEKCREEINSILADRENLSFEDLSKLPLTTAVLKEVLRLFTTIPLYGRIATRDVVVDGHCFDKGTHFMLLSFIANESEKSFDDEHQFRPERYMDADNKKLGVSFTFGYGPYSCIGKHFAMQELKVIVVRLLQNFKFTIDPECEQFYRKVKITQMFVPPLKIRVHTL